MAQVSLSISPRPYQKTVRGGTPLSSDLYPTHPQCTCGHAQMGSVSATGTYRSLSTDLLPLLGVPQIYQAILQLYV